MKQKWCKPCKAWFDASEGCEVCGYEGEAFNKYLRTAMLNEHLYGLAGTVKKEATDAAHFVRQAKREQARVARS